MTAIPVDTRTFYTELVEKRDLAETKADLIKTIVLIGGLQIAIITALLLKLSQVITH